MIYIPVLTKPANRKDLLELEKKGKRAPAEVYKVSEQEATTTAKILDWPLKTSKDYEALLIYTELRIWPVKYN